jgi:heptosyltransferase I
MGDMVLLSSVIDSFMEKNQNTEITLVCGEDNIETARLFFKEKVTYLPISHKKPFGWLQLRKLERMSLVFDFGQWSRFDALISLLIKSDYHTGFKREGQYRHFCYDKAVRHSDERHEIDNFYELCRGFDLDKRNPFLNIQSIDKNIKRVIVHIFTKGVSAEYRTLSFEKWAELLEKLKEYEVVLTGEAHHEDYLRMLVKEANLNNCTFLLNRPLDELCIAMKNSYKVVTVDTGIAHLASACGADVIEIFCSSNPKRWGALGNKVQYITPESCGRMLSLGHEKNIDKTAAGRVNIDNVLRCM